MSAFLRKALDRWRRGRALTRLRDAAADGSLDLAFARGQAELPALMSAAAA